MSNIGGTGPTNVNHALDGQSQVTFIVSILSLATVISTAVVVLRIFTRSRILRTFGPDDAVMGIAQLLTIGAAVAIGLGMSPFHITHKSAVLATSSFYHYGLVF